MTNDSSVKEERRCGDSDAIVVGGGTPTAALSLASELLKRLLNFVKCDVFFLACMILSLAIIPQSG